MAFWAPVHRKDTLDIMGGQNQIKNTKGHQVQIFKKFIFELPCTEKSILDVMEGQNWVKVISGDSSNYQNW